MLGRSGTNFQTRGARGERGLELRELLMTLLQAVSFQTGYAPRDDGSFLLEWTPVARQKASNPERLERVNMLMRGQG